MLDFGPFADLFTPGSLVQTVVTAAVSGLVGGAVAVALTLIYGRR